MKKRDLGNELCLAVFRADRQKVEQLLAEGADVNAVGDRRTASIADKTPLWSATHGAGMEIAGHWRAFCEALSDAFPSIRQSDHAGKRASYIAIVKVLIAAGANLDQHCHGTTPLVLAIKERDLEIVEILLSNGANPNADTFSVLSNLARREGRKTFPGYYDTVLHNAVEKNSSEIVKALLDAGADPTRADHEGKTPLDLARKKGYSEISHLLEQSDPKLKGR